MAKTEEDIFLKALGLHGEDREQYLSQACDGDSRLRDRVCALLKANDDESFVLNRQDVTHEIEYILSDSSEKNEVAGSHVGRYKLLQQIGEGGMGVVYMAQQTDPVTRQVAVKIIRSGMNSRQVVMRFEAERQALARMEHPNITRMLDAGVTQTGRPYFVMELVRGMSITDYCDKHQICVTERLKLFSQVCRAVHHAHQRGILHRDIKPGNVMITMHDGVPVPKVIDFGIAKALDRPLTQATLFTHYGEMIGTPQYMSPEQAEFSGLDLDVRCDVYSLGALLFELLTGTAPLDVESLKQGGLLKLFETIRDSEIETASSRITQMGEAIGSIANNRKASPASLGKLVKGELDWIAAKALAKDRTRRYENAGTFADDIDRFLKGLPTLAAAPSSLYQFRKLVGRNKLASSFAAGLLIAMISGTVISTYFAVQATTAQRSLAQRVIDLDREKKLSDQRRHNAELALARAEKAESEANRLGREKQNNAVISRAMSRLVIESLPVDVRNKLQWNIGDLTAGRSSSTFIEAGGASFSEQALAGSETVSVHLEPINGTYDKNVLPAEIFKYEDGIALLGLILEEQRREFGSQDVFVANTLVQRAEQYLASALYRDAELDLREAINIFRSNPSEIPIDQYENTLARMIECLRRQEKAGQSQELQNELDHLRE